MSPRRLRWLIASGILLICAFLAFQTLTLEVGLYRYKSGDMAGALPWLRAAMVLNPFTPAVRAPVATILVHQGRLDEAERIIRKSLQKQPNNSQNHNIMGMILERQGDKDGALDEYRAALKTDPKNSAAMFNIGYLFFKMKQFDKTREYLDQAVRANPELAKSKDDILKMIPPPQPGPLSPSPTK